MILMNNIFKLVLVVLLLVCLADMPYGYYQLVRFVAMVAFGWLAYESYKENRETQVFIYIALTLLFQPLFKIALGREIWNIVDVLVALGLLASIWIKPVGRE